MNIALSFFTGHHAHAFLFATLFLIIGIITACLPATFFASAIILLLSLIPLILSYTTSYIPNYQWVLLPLFFIAGLLLYQKQIQDHYAFQEKFSNTPLTLVGTVASLEKIQNARHRWIMIIDLHKIATGQSNSATTESVAIYSVKKPFATIGDTIELSDIIFKRIQNSSFNLYLAKEKMSATAFIDSPRITILNHPSWNINRFIAQLRNRIFTQLQHTMDKETFALFSSIFLGNRNAVKLEMDHAKEPFKYWGTSHYLARSGLHLVIFGIIWHFILGFLPFLFFWKQIILILLITSYSLLSWASVSFNRALIMFFLGKLCLLAHHRLHYVHLISLATSLVLLFNPLQLFFLDFQLSFGLTFALAWFTHIQQHKKSL